MTSREEHIGWLRQQVAKHTLLFEEAMQGDDWFLQYQRDKELWCWETDLRKYEKGEAR